jgi:hypothetical protein
MQNADRVIFTLKKYVADSVESMTEWATNNQYGSVLDDLNKAEEWCVEESALDYFFGHLGKYISSSEASRFQEMSLLFKEYRTKSIKNDEWYESVWASELPYTFNYIWERGAV